MTTDDLRALVLKAARGSVEAQEQLFSLAPDLARLCAELAEAAENTLRSFKEEMDAWSYAEYDGRKHTHEELSPGLTSALAKLSELEAR